MTKMGYGASYCADKDMPVALICMGYGDGLPRALSNRGCAEFQGRQLPIIGRICMDYCLLDASNGPLKVGAHVNFWGETLPLSSVAELIDSIPYTLMTGVNPRVQRITIKPPALQESIKNGSQKR
ncbi:MAG: alanine racemase C-terminal domain-containing protein [Mariprofundaceae bacterium]|nr:alanine racemase C-terminal domain-containing protein [Mariprofundaceae bacterium]